MGLGRAFWLITRIQKPFRRLMDSQSEKNETHLGNL